MQPPKRDASSLIGLILGLGAVIILSTALVFLVRQVVPLT
jgi:hypothetical protein